MKVSWTKQPQAGSALAGHFPRLWEFASDDETAIKYAPEFREFSIPVIDGPSMTSGIVIEYDPWTGRALPSSLRDKWFDAVAELGFADDLGSLLDKALPEEFRSEDWWVRRGL